MKTLSMATAFVAAALAFSLSGCGSHHTAASNPATSSSTSSENDLTVKLAHCLRQHGIDASTSVDSEGEVKLELGKDVHGGDPKFQAAQRACAQYSPQNNGDKMSAADLDRLVKVAACMRKNGVNVQDPTVAQPGLKIEARNLPQSKVEQVRGMCQKQVPGGDNGG